MRINYWNLALWDWDVVGRDSWDYLLANAGLSGLLAFPPPRPLSKHRQNRHRAIAPGINCVFFGFQIVSWPNGKTLLNSKTIVAFLEMGCWRSSLEFTFLLARVLADILACVPTIQTAAKGQKAVALGIYFRHLPAFPLSSHGWIAGATRLEWCCCWKDPCFLTQWKHCAKI